MDNVALSIICMRRALQRFSNCEEQLVYDDYLEKDERSHSYNSHFLPLHRHSNLWARKAKWLPIHRHNNALPKKDGHSPAGKVQELKKELDDESHSLPQRSTKFVYE